MQKKNNEKTKKHHTHKHTEYIHRYTCVKLREKAPCNTCKHERPRLACSTFQSIRAFHVSHMNSVIPGEHRLLADQTPFKHMVKGPSCNINHVYQYHDN